MERSIPKMSEFVVIFGVVLAVLLANSVAAQKVHVVGDTIGWEIPKNGAAAYSNWASSNTFVVGDILTFNFATNASDVLQVPKESFDNCSSANPIGKSIITTGPVNVTLASVGYFYYICTFGRHCQEGQKLAINVSAPLPGVALSPGTLPVSSSSSVVGSFVFSFLSVVVGLFCPI